MRICHVFQDEYPWDVRVEKISLTLVDRGHPTVIVSRNRSGRPRRESLRPGLDVVRLPAGATAVDRAIVNTPAFFSPFWLSAIVDAVRNENLDVILVRDLPLAATAVWAGRIVGKPVVMDMAENYPAMLQDTKDLGKFGPLDFIIRNPNMLRALERWVIPRLQGVFTVSDASKERVERIARGQVPVWVVGNTPRIPLAGNPVQSELAEKIKSHPGLVLLYVGGMDPKRGLDFLVRSVVPIRKVEPDVLVVIVGKGMMESSLRELARELDVEQNVLLAGWMDPREVLSVTREADIGMIPHLVTEHTDTTIPNKIFDYMANGLPVVVTHCRTLRSIVEETGCGRVCRDRDPQSIADAVLSLTDDAERRKTGEAGRQAVIDKYHWGRDADTLVAALSQIVENHAVVK